MYTCIYVHTYICIYINMYNGIPLFQTPWDKYKCFDYRGVLISGVNCIITVWDIFVSVLDTGV